MRTAGRSAVLEAALMSAVGFLPTLLGAAHGYVRAVLHPEYCPPLLVARGVLLVEENQIGGLLFIGGREPPWPVGYRIYLLKVPMGYRSTHGVSFSPLGIVSPISSRKVLACSARQAPR